MANNKVVIVGAGPAGLSAAYTLKKKGVDFVLVEAAPRIGGRCQSLHLDPDHPEYYITTGPFFTEPCEEETIRLLDELDLGDRNVLYDKMAMCLYFDGKAHWVRADGNIAHMLGSVKGMPAALVPQGVRLLRNLGKVKKRITRPDGSIDYREMVNAVGQYNVVEWGEKFAGPEIVDKLLAPLTGGIIAEPDPTKLSAIQPVCTMIRMNGIAQIKGGHAVINDAMYETFRENVRLSTPVEEIVVDGGRVTGVRVSGGEVIEADQVICCTDGQTASRLVPGAPAYVPETLKTCTYSTSYCYTFRFDKRPWPEHALLVLMSPSANSKLTIMIEENSMDLAAAPGSGQMRVFTAGTHDEYWRSLSEEERARAVRAEAAKILPEFATDGEIVHVWHYEQALNHQGVGQFEALYAMEETLPDDVKGLHFAGEYQSVHSSMEGSYASGRREAEAVAAALA